MASINEHVSKLVAALRSSGVLHEGVANELLKDLDAGNTEQRANDERKFDPTTGRIVDAPAPDDNAGNNAKAGRKSDNAAGAGGSTNG